MNNKNEILNDYLKEKSEKELEDYRNSLIFTRECPACHYAQGIVFLGVGFFTAIRMQFIWQSLNWKQILGFSSLSIIASSLGVYKFSYAFHIFQLQGRIKKIKDNEKIDNKNL
jgi:hypothetical protein